MFESIHRKVLTEDKLEQLRKENIDKKIVFCTGCYDILQSGHAVFFNQCKDLGDILVVGVGRDVVIKALKGAARPVNPENNRLYLVAAMHDVDFAVLNGSEILEGKIDFKNVLEQLRPDIFVLNDDDSGLEHKSKICNRLGVEIQFVSRVVPPQLLATSTTKIIEKINFSYKAPLRIDFAGGWTDVPYIMNGLKGYVSNVAIKPLIEIKDGVLNFGGYPRGSGLSTSTAVKALQMISAKTYNSDAKSLTEISEDLFNLENEELNWAIGRQDQYSIIFGGYNTFEFGQDYGRVVHSDVSKEILEEFKKGLLLLHTSVSRNAQSVVEQVYKSYKTTSGIDALKKLADYGLQFGEALQNKDYDQCARIMELNFDAQKQLAPSSSNEELDEMYRFARMNGALGGKICGAGGGGALIFYCKDRKNLIKEMKKRFVDCFEIDFEIEYDNIKQLNLI